MKKPFAILSAGLLMAGAAQAVTLNLPASGNHANGTVITTAQSYNGATFNISYTLGSTTDIGTSTIESTGTQLGVIGSGDGTNTGLFATVEGADDEGISFSSLSITDFQANGSMVTQGDITDLKFTKFSVNNAGNGSDDINIGYTSFTNTDNVNLRNGALDQTVDLENLTNYPGTPTGLYLIGSNNNANNRWAVTGLEVTYAIPEPSSSAMLLGGIGVVALLRRRK